MTRITGERKKEKEKKRKAGAREGRAGVVWRVIK